MSVTSYSGAGDIARRLKRPPRAGATVGSEKGLKKEVVWSSNGSRSHDRGIC
jgi:hypothetical protein